MTRPTLAVYHLARLAPAIVLLQKQASPAPLFRSAASDAEQFVTRAST